MQSTENGNRIDGAQARTGDLATQVVQDAQRLVSLEMALAKQEAKDLVKANAIAAGMIGFGGLLLVLALLVAVPSLVVVLVPWHWQAAAAWVVLYALLGLGLAVIGKSRIRIRLPARTVASLKENKEWALRRMKSTVR
ncbi:MAG TPA: phage holin family protein [Candidatus Dormibacteraeota bacterium]